MASTFGQAFAKSDSNALAQAIAAANASGNSSAFSNAFAQANTSGGCGNISNALAGEQAGLEPAQPGCSALWLQCDCAGSWVRGQLSQPVTCTLIATSNPSCASSH